MLRWVASKFFIASRQNIAKSKQCWDQLLPNLSSGRSWDIGKIIVFQGKRIDFRITGILENPWFWTKNKQTIFRTKINGKLQQICTKSLKNVKRQETMRMLFLFWDKKQKRERWERGEEGKSSKEREGSKRARQDLIHSLTPDRPPLAAITGNCLRFAHPAEALRG